VRLLTRQNSMVTFDLLCTAISKDSRRSNNTGTYRGDFRAEEEKS
jgi:hypothetical protein